MRAARYVRVSSEAQADNTSIPNQLERTASYVAAQGWELAATFVEPGETGANLDRPALTAARRAAVRHEFDVLTVYTLDRLSRDLDDVFLLRREFSALGVQVIIVRDGLDVTTANLDALLAVLIGGYVGHRELDNIRRRMREGMDRRIRSGKTPGGHPRFGYRREGDGLAVADEHAAVLRQIFAWAAEGESTWGIAGRLDALGIASSTGKLWHSSTIQKILHDPVYWTGCWVVTWQGERYEIPCPPLVDRETWEAAQRGLERNRMGGRKPTRAVYMLSGMVKCECGMTFIVRPARRQGGPHRYGCSARMDSWRARRRPAICPTPTVGGPQLEAAIWASVVEFITQPERVIVALQAGRDVDAGARIAAQLGEVDRALAERRAEESRYLTLFGRGTIPVDLLEAQVAQVRRQCETLEVYRQELAREQARLDAWELEMGGVSAVLEVLQARLAAGVSDEDKRAIVRLLVKGVVISGRAREDGTLYPVARVTYRFERPWAGEVSIPAEAVELFAGAARRLTGHVPLEWCPISRQALEIEVEIELR